MDEVLLYNIIKWVLIVFVAGFIGYFGKHLSKIIIKKFSKKSEPSQTIVHKYETPDKYKAKIEKKKLKLEKKRIKALKKKNK